MNSLEDVEKVLQTYEFIEVLELNDVTQEEALHSLVRLGVVQLPNPRPL